jgi:hypothetical protein
LSLRDRPLYAVLIDADNIPAKHAEAILKEITNFGEPALRRVYGDWSSDLLKGWPDKIRALGLVAHQETANSTRKNATDIGLVIDAMDILHSGRFDGFVLVSSDGDFTRLASRIREEGLEVIGIGEKKAPEAFLKVCNRFVLIENILPESEAQRVARKPAKDALPLLLKAMNRVDTEDEWYHLGQLGQAILADNPDFDVRTYGESKLSGLVGKLNKLEMRKTGNQPMVRSKASSTK